MADTSKKIKPNKNQTAVQRAEENRINGQRSTDHVCASPKCPKAGQRILLSELKPVMVVPVKGRARMQYFHTSCEL